MGGPRAARFVFSRINSGRYFFSSTFSPGFGGGFFAGGGGACPGGACGGGAGLAAGA